MNASPLIRTTGQAFVAGLVGGVAAVPPVQGYILARDYEHYHSGQPKTIPTALGTMVMSVAGLNQLATGIRSNTAAIRTAAAVQGAAAGFGVAGGAAVLGYLVYDSLNGPRTRPAS
jgi:hypothetical protein